MSDRLTLADPAQSLRDEIQAEHGVDVGVTWLHFRLMRVYFDGMDRMSDIAKEANENAFKIFRGEP